MSTRHKTGVFTLIAVLHFVILFNAYGEDHKKLIQQYNSGDLTDKRLAVKSLKHFIDKPLFSFFREASTHSDHLIRGHALEGISHFQTGEALRILKKSLMDPSPVVVRHSIPLFKQFPLPEAVDALVPLLKHADEQIVSNVIDVLGHIGNKDIVFNLAPYLKDSRADVQLTTYQSIGTLVQKHRKEFREKLDADFEVALKKNSIKTIDKLTDIILSSFIKTWANEENLARKNALWCLGVITETFLGKLDTYIMFEEDNRLRSMAEGIKNRLISIIPSLLTSFDKSNDNELKWHLINCLSKFKHKEALPVFIKGLKDDYYLVRLDSLQGLIELDHRASIPAILPLLNDPMVITRIRAIETIERLGTKENTAQLLPYLNSNNTQVKWHIAKALGALENKEAVQPLISLIGSKSELIRSMAVQSLGKLGFTEAIQSLIDASKDDSYLVREQVGYALGKLESNEESFSTLIELLADKNKYVRRRAFDSIFSILKNPAKKAKYKKMLPLIFPVLKDKDSYIKANASKLLKIMWISE